MGNMDGEKSKTFLKVMKKKGIKTKEDLDKLTADEQLEFMTEVKMDSRMTESIEKAENETIRYILEYGIDPKKHSFVDSKDKTIELDFNFWDCLGMPNLVDFLVREIKNFSKDIQLGE